MNSEAVKQKLDYDLRSKANKPKPVEDAKSNWNDEKFSTMLQDAMRSVDEAEAKERSHIPDIDSTASIERELKEKVLALHERKAVQNEQLRKLLIEMRRTNQMLETNMLALQFISVGSQV